MLLKICHNEPHYCTVWSFSQDKHKIKDLHELNHEESCVMEQEKQQTLQCCGPSGLDFSNRNLLID